MYPQSALTGGGTRDYYPNEIARQITSEHGRSLGGRRRLPWQWVATRLAGAFSVSSSRAGAAQDPASGAGPRPDPDIPSAFARSAGLRVEASTPADQELQSVGR